MGHYQVGRHVKVTGVLLYVSKDQLKQCGFTSAIGACDSDLVSSMNSKSCVIDKHTRASANAQVVKRQHSLVLI